MVYYLNCDSCVYDGRNQGMQLELPGVLRRDAASHSLLEETCKGFRTCARSPSCVLRSVVAGGDGMGILVADVFWALVFTVVFVGLNLRHVCCFLCDNYRYVRVFGD